jgi:tetratricopeptide (TPR) repeat protein
MGDYAACRPLGEAMLAIDPFQPWGHLALASWAMLGAEDAALAAPYLASARELGADRPGVLVRLGGLELIAGRDAVAAADFEAALARDPAAADAAYGAGLAHHRLGNHAAAEKLLRQAVMLEHHMPLAHAHLGVALAALGRHEDAILSLTTAHAQSGDVHIAAMLSRAREALAHSLARNAIATAARAETRAVP